jgi:lysyl-tRNA synthetase, class II
VSIPTYEEIIGHNDQIAARAEHLQKLQELIGNLYPNKFDRSNITGGEDTITALVKFARPIKEKYVAEGERPTDEQHTAANEELNKYRVRTSGRLAVPPRIMGKAAFVHLSDGVERLQIYVRKQDAKAVNNDTGANIETEGSGWELFNLLDHGDFVGVEGFLFLTKTGELSIHVETIQFLSKALLPMPDKLHGIEDAEVKQRRRYIDLIASSLKIEREENELTTREVFETRSRLITGMRRYLDEHGYIEVETPMLTPKATGAAAKPFVTHHNALNIDLYARIAPELYLKRLVVGGFEKVYEINRNFRNEGISTRHNPEFTMLEFYCAYMDVNGMMDFAEKMIQESVQKAAGGLKVKFGENEIDFSKFERLTMKQAIVKYSHNYLPSDFEESWLDDDEILEKLANFVEILYMRQNYRVVTHLSKAAEIVHLDNINDYLAKGYSYDPEQVKHTVELAQFEKTINWQAISKSKDSLGGDRLGEARAVVKIFEGFVEKLLIHPTFITDFPKAVSPLSKASPENPQIAERFELFINGMECANGFSELNDPQEQYNRFADQLKERERGDDEAMVLDEDYVYALAYGMPPAAGIGIGIDRLVMLLTNRHSIRDVILFPHLRPERSKAQEETADEN